MITQPSISVVIPVYNGMTYLAAALDSVFSQTYLPSEVIVIDDGSTDGTAQVVAQYPRVKYFYQANQGASVSRNQGISLAQGDYIAFLDADDLWLPDKLALQIAVLQKTPADLVLGHMSQFISPELPAEVQAKLVCPIEPNPGYSASVALIKREIFARVGLFDPQWRMGEFIDWYTKAVEQGISVLMLKEIVAKRRLHKTNMGITQQADRRDYLRIIKDKLNRQRQQHKLS